MKSPIFIFSLPRSGSTLLQRILMSHKKVASASEPWILLPFLYSLKEDGQVSEYSQSLSVAALKDFIYKPEKDVHYEEYLKKFILSLYNSYCDHKEEYFLDKTPRYYFIISEIHKIFPDAKFIFLFRNPVHIYSSILTTWGNDRFNKLHSHYVDLEKGPALLSEGYEKYKDVSYALKYEEFVMSPEKYLKELLDYLELEYDDSMLDNFSLQKTYGSMGDPTGTKQYSKVQTESLEKWKKTFATPLRMYILKKYIKGLDAEVLRIQGYSKENILEEIDNLDTDIKNIFQDSMDIFYFKLIKKLKLNLIYGSSKEWAHKTYLS